MIWTYWSLCVAGTPENLLAFLRLHDIPEKPLSLSVIAPVAALDDEQIMTTWGCGYPEPLKVPYLNTWTNFFHLRYRTPGGPPSTWLLRAAKAFPLLSFNLTHGTEATGILGEIDYIKGVRKTTEVEGDYTACDAFITNAQRNW